MVRVGNEIPVPDKGVVLVYHPAVGLSFGGVVFSEGHGPKRPRHATKDLDWSNGFRSFFFNGQSAFISISPGPIHRPDETPDHHAHVESLLRDRCVRFRSNSNCSRDRGSFGLFTVRWR